MNIPSDVGLEETVEGFRLSPQQKHLWLNASGEDWGRSQCAILIEGPYATTRLEVAIKTVIERHESLRTVFRSLLGMDVPIQSITDEIDVRLEARNIAGSPSIEQAIDEHLHEDAIAALDRQAGSSGRYTFLKRSAESGALLITLPSMSADAASLINLYAQIAAICAEREVETGEEFVQYADYSEWKNGLLESDGGEKLGKYWKSYLETAPEAVRLPLETPSGDALRGPAERIKATVGAALFSKLNALSLARNASLPAIALTGFGALIWRLNERRPFTLGCLFDGRRMSGLASAVGLFAKYLPVEMRIEEDYTFVEALRRVDNNLSRAEEGQDYFPPGSRPRGESAAAGSSPLPIKFEWRELPQKIESGRAQFSLLRLASEVDRYELKVICTQSADKLEFEFDYNPVIYSAEGVERLASRFIALLEDIAETPERPLKFATITSSAERRLEIDQWNRTGRSYPTGVCLHQLFERQAARTPEAVAVMCGDQALSFAQLNARANRAARRLRELGVGPEIAVGVCLERSVNVLTAALAIWKAGGVYLPLDPDQPSARLTYLIEDAGCRVLATQESFAAMLSDMGLPLIRLDVESDLPATTTDGDLPPSALPGNLAYIIYTSGSTGKPKGVMTQHASVVNLGFALQDVIYREAGPSTVGVNAPLAFDASIKQLIQIVHGHCVYFIPEELRLDAGALSAYTAARKIDVLDCTPSQLNVWLAADRPEGLAGLPETLLVGGEALEEKNWLLLSRQGRKCCFNLYGPTECTVDATISEIRHGKPTIGKPIPNVRAYVLDENLDPAPIGSSGGLYIGGESLARGYLRGPARTGERFLPDPFAGQSGARMYHTGDLARRSSDGSLECLGRTDHQVKLQGVRIELGEIEQVLSEHPAVSQAAVVVRKDEAGQNRLVGYVLPKRRSMKKIDGQLRHVLPNGKAIAHRNKHETQYLYEEIFEREAYLQHGLRLPQNAVVFDVGANIGMFSLYITERFPDARIYAFEPIPPILNAFRINAELYAPTVKLFPYGISNKNETAAFTYYPHYSVMSGRAAYSSAGADIDVIKRYLANQQADGGGAVDELVENADEILSGRFAAESYECALRTLSAILADEQIERIDLLKIDVQRAELDVLTGVRNEDWPRIHQLVMEVHDAPGQETEGRLEKMKALLGRQGFEVQIEQDGLLQGTDRYTLYALRPGAGSPSPEPPAARAATNGSPVCSDVLTPQELRRYLQERLPGYMTPAGLHILEEMPLTRNGKIDRAELASLDPLTARTGANILAPQTGVQRRIAAIWEQLLGVERVGLEDKFFDLGGNSLLLVQLQRRLRDEFKTEISVLNVFQRSTVAGLAEYFKRKNIESKPEPQFDQARERAGKIRKAVNSQKKSAKAWKGSNERK